MPPYLEKPVRLRSLRFAKGRGYSDSQQGVKPCENAFSAVSGGIQRTRGSIGLERFNREMLEKNEKRKDPKQN